MKFLLYLQQIHYLKHLRKNKKDQLPNSLQAINKTINKTNNNLKIYHKYNFLLRLSLKHNLSLNQEIVLFKFNKKMRKNKIIN